MSSKTLQLAESLERISASLDSKGESHWASWLRGDAARLRSGDASGISHFLGAFGAMGSLNDLSIPYDDPIQKEIGEAHSFARALARHYGL